MEKGINKGGRVDSLTRGIMIHGTPEEGLIGTPTSHGCIRMKNQDIINLFDKIDTNTKVIIENKF
jgi:lipoprotein-anchoring transpeptidase ErfK/SrfK